MIKVRVIVKTLFLSLFEGFTKGIRKRYVNLIGRFICAVENASSGDEAAA